MNAKNIEYLYSINFGTCHVCYINGDYTHKPIAFWDDESETGFCVHHILEAVDYLYKKMLEKR